MSALGDPLFEDCGEAAAACRADIDREDPVLDGEDFTPEGDAPIDTVESYNRWCALARRLGLPTS